MALTDSSHVFSLVTEKALNRIVRQIQRQRPSLFNYATEAFRSRPRAFCEPIEADPAVARAGNPLFTVQGPIPVLGTPFPIGLNWCLQFTHFEVDLHPNNVVQLPPELGQLDEQRIAVRLRGCFGLDCPNERFFDAQVPLIEEIVVREKDLAKRFDDLIPRDPAKDGGKPDKPEKEPPPPVVPPLSPRMRCFCLEIFVVVHFEWGTIGNDLESQWVKTRLDGLEIVDLGPEELEASIECYLRTVLRLGVLPRLSISIESMVLDITKTLRQQIGINLSQSVRLEPAQVPADVPNNPAVEKDEIRVFVNLVVEDL